MRRMITGKQIEALEKLDENIKFNENDVTITVPYESEGSEVNFVLGDSEAEGAPGIYLNDNELGYGLNLGVFDNAAGEYNPAVTLRVLDSETEINFPMEDSNTIKVANTPIATFNSNIVNFNKPITFSDQDNSLQYNTDTDRLELYATSPIRIFGDGPASGVNLAVNSNYININSSGFEISRNDEQFIDIDQYGFKLTGVPTTDPHRQGYLWNDNGVLKISLG